MARPRSKTQQQPGNPAAAGADSAGLESGCSEQESDPPKSPVDSDGPKSKSKQAAKSYTEPSTAPLFSNPAPAPNQEGNKRAAKTQPAAATASGADSKPAPPVPPVLSPEAAQEKMDNIGRPLFEIVERQGRPAEDVIVIRQAFEFAYKSHDGQVRKSDEPYIIHPVEVATALAELNADVATVCAGLMHDVLEDCDVSPQQMEAKFGSDITKIVEGVTKLGKFSFSSKEERQAENFRKLIVAIAEDVRVVLVKLADRLHNMRTLDHMRAEIQKEIATETLEIYAPLANRFGLGRM